MKQTIKEWLSMAFTPTLILAHYYTQWQGLLNVFGAICVLISVFMMFIIALMFILVSANEVPKFPFPKLSGLQRTVGIFIMIATSVYLLWTGHLVVAAFYIIASVLGWVALLVMWVISQNE